MSIPSTGAPPLAKVAQPRDNISSLVETVVNPPSNLKSITSDTKTGQTWGKAAYHFNRRVARSERLQTLRRGYLSSPKLVINEKWN